MEHSNAWEDSSTTFETKQIKQQFKKPLHDNKHWL